MTQQSATTATVRGESSVRSVKRYKEMMLKSKPELVISAELASQIMFNHLSNPNVEWSGFLFYQVEEGSLADISKLKLKAVRMYLHDIGTAGYTSFEMTPEKVVDMATSVPEYEDSKMGIIHTHHNMNCFFSGTDQDELQENAEAHIYYLSLIVNHKGPWCARIAIPAVRKNNTVILRRDEETGQKMEFPENLLSQDAEEEVLYIADCSITHELQPWYIENLDRIEEENRRPAPVVYNQAGFQYGQSGTNAGGNLNSGQSGGSPYIYTIVSDAMVRAALTITFKNYIMPRGYTYVEYQGLLYNARPMLFDCVKPFVLKVNTPKPITPKNAGKVAKDFVGMFEEVLDQMCATNLTTNEANMVQIYKEAITIIIAYKSTFGDDLVYNSLLQEFVAQRDLNQEFLNERNSAVTLVN
jgi:proteasome lid subunit RPN8/RPN11